MTKEKTSKVRPKKVVNSTVDMAVEQEVAEEEAEDQEEAEHTDPRLKVVIILRPPH